MSRRRELLIVWEGPDLDEYTEVNLDAVDLLDIGYLLRMGGLDVSDPTSAVVAGSPGDSEPMSSECDETPPWHAYDGCYGCRQGEAVNRRIARARPLSPVPVEEQT